MPGSRRRLEWLLAGASVIAALAGAEAGLRLLAPPRDAPTGYAPVNTKRRAMRPTNAGGFRDLPREEAKPEGVRRVLSLGDSFAWGASVEFEDAYPQRLERGLTRRREERWEVVNLALPGMNTVEQAAQLEERGFAYQPDVVLLGYVLNDSEDTGSAETRRAHDWQERHRERGTGTGPRSALYDFVAGRVWATRENRRRIDAYRSMYADDATGWRAGREALRRMAEQCRARGIPFVVAIFPLFGNPLDETYPFEGLHARVAEAVIDSRSTMVDLLPAYRGLRWDLLVVDGERDEHPNEIAHRIAAAVLLRALDDVVPWAGAAAARETEGPDGS